MNTIVADVVVVVVVVVVDVVVVVVLPNGDGTVKRPDGSHHLEEHKGSNDHGDTCWWWHGSVVSVQSVK